MLRTMILILLALTGVLSDDALASTPGREVEVECPLDNTRFKAWLGGSGYAAGVNLDLKPNGAIFAPFPLAKCPSNGFVLYKQKYSEDELRLFRKIVTSDEYQGLQAKETNHFLAAKLMAYVKESPRDVAHAYLRSTWNAGIHYEDYASAALQALELSLMQPYPDRQQWLSDQMVAGELERRLERFIDARKRFLALAALAELKDEKNKRLRELVQFQLQLIELEDAASHLATADALRVAVYLAEVRAGLINACKNADDAARLLPKIEGLSIALGDSICRVQAILQTRRMPNFASSPSSRYQDGYYLSVPEKGVATSFSPEGKVETIRLQPPFSGRVAGVRLGDELSSVRELLGEPKSKHSVLRVDDSYNANFTFDQSLRVVAIHITAWGLKVPKDQ